MLGRAGQAQPDLTGPVPRGRAGRALGNPSQRNKQREGLLAPRLQHWGLGAVAFGYSWLRQKRQRAGSPLRPTGSDRTHQRGAGQEAQPHRVISAQTI